VSRVFEEGNAAKFANQGGEKILLGDHLVSIDGNATIYKTVPQVCKLLSLTHDPSSIALTFLRYVGPLRPAMMDVEHEGYEVIDPILSKPVSQIRPNTPNSDLPPASGSSNHTPIGSQTQTQTNWQTSKTLSATAGESKKKTTKFKLFRFGRSK